MNVSKMAQKALRLIVTLSLLICVTTAKAQQNLVIIANQKVPSSVISWKELKLVFMGEKQRWSNGSKIIIALMKTNNPLGLAISNKIYDMKPDELNKFWLALVFQGKASAPMFFNSVSELQDFVSQTPGAIGIADQVIESQTIKTITVDGKKAL